MNMSRYLRLAGTGIIGAVAIWFYYWTAGSPKVFAGPQIDYYNRLVDGFQEGSLAMKVARDANGRLPYLMDASLYEGKYYLYFGVTPVLVLLWPWSVVTGHDLPEGPAACLFAAAALGLSVGWLAALRRRFFPDTGAVAWLAVVLLMALAVPYPVTLRHPLFYEIAILSGLAFSFGGLWGLTLALLRPERAVAWLAAGSLCAGLAAGSRPTLIPGAVLAVAVAGACVIVQDRRRGNRALGRSLRLVAAAVGPLGACGLAMAWYNWARFGRPTDFGLLYQQGANPHGFPFTLGFLWKNLLVYYLTPPDFSWFFPFFTPGPKPGGSYPEQVHGQFYILPLFALAAARGFWAWRRSENRGEGLGAILAVSGAWAAGAFVFVGMAWAHANRYLLDFHPVFLVLTALGLWACLQAGGWWRQTARAAFVWSVVVVIFSVCVSFHVQGYFKGTWPEQYERLARATDRLVWPLHRLSGPRLGGMELMVRFPAGTPGTMEPLVVAGGGNELDGLMVKYTTPGRARLMFMHLGLGEVESEDFDLQPGRQRWLKVHLGSLYPPAWHPWYDSQPPGMARAIDHLSVTLDGVTLLERDVKCYQASANQVAYGRRDGFPFGGERFAGTVERVRGLHGNADWVRGLGDARGALHLKLLLPRDRFGSEEPLLMTGSRWSVDLVSIHYVREGIVRFSVLHEGWAEIMTTPEIPWDYLRPLEVLINLGSLAPTEGLPRAADAGVQIDVDGRIVLSRRFKAHPAAPTQVYIGSIPWAVAGSRPMFGGVILGQSRLREDLAPLQRARQNLLAGRPVTLEFALPAEAAWPNQPVFTTGITGRGDGIFLEPAGPGRARVIFDHWGSQATRSPPVALATGAKHRVTVSLGTRVSPEVTVPGQLQVHVDGQPAFDLHVDLFQALPEQVFLGANPIGMSSGQPVMAGGVSVIEDLPEN